VTKAVGVAEAAKELGLTPTAVYRHVQRGNLPAVRLGRRVLISREVLDRLTKSTAERPEIRVQ